MSSNSLALIPIAVPPLSQTPPPGWTWTRLSEVARLESGHTPSRNRQDWWGGDISWLSLTEIRRFDGGWVSETQIKTNEEGIANSAARILPRGTVCLSRTASVGFVAVMDQPMATSQDFANWVCGEKLLPEFLMFALIRARNYLRSLAVGATHKTIYMPTLQEFHICLPSLMRQEKIIGRLKLALALVSEIRLAAIQRLTDARALRERTLRQVFSDIANTPQKVLGRFATTTSGSTPSRDRKSYWYPAEIPWVKTSEVAFEPIYQTEEAISREALASVSLTLLPRDTVLVAMYGQGKTRGQSAILKIEAATNQACFAVLPNDTWDPEFLFYWFMANYNAIRARSADRGGNQANLNSAILNQLQIPAPERNNQLRIVERLRKLMFEMDAIEAAAAASVRDIERMPERLLTDGFHE